MVKMKTPSAMKDSGIEWIGKIPEHWDVRKLSHICETITDFTASGSFEDLAANVKYLDTEDYARLIRTADLSGKREVKPVYINEHSYNYLNNSNLFGGEVILPNIGASIGDVYRYIPIYERATLAPNAIMLRSRGSNEYLYYLFYTNQFRNFINLESSSTAQGKFNKTQLRAFKIPHPPIEEQRLIAVQLNQICGTLDNMKSDIEKQIETLNEYKKSLITESVTKGLDKNVELKDSFNEFIEKIPKHWKLMKAKYVAKTIFRGNGITKEQVIENGNIQCIRYGEIYSKYDNSIEHCVSKTNLELINSPKYIQYEDILFAITGELVEEIGKNVIYLGNEACLVGGDILVLRPEGNAKYLNYVLNCKTSQEQKSFGKAKLKVVHNSLSDIGNMYIPIPPIEEQQEIVTYLDSKCSEIDSIIETKKQQLELLEEYKKSIIYEYVTGKREASIESAGDLNHE